MTPFLYPGQDLPNWLAEHNQRTNTGRLTGTGVLSMAFDVWRDGEHLFRSYDPSTGEDLDAWSRRNFPMVENPDYQASLFGAGPLVGGIDNYPVPTRASCLDRVTYQRASEILRAALATAQWPVTPDVANYVPNGNAIRQKMHHLDRDWLSGKVVHVGERVVIRYVIVRTGGSAIEDPKARYRAQLFTRGSSAKEPRFEPREVEFESYVADLSDGVDRRGVVKAAKTALGLVGYHAACKESTGNTCRFALSTIPHDFRIEWVADLEYTAPNYDGGFDIA